MKEHSPLRSFQFVTFPETLKSLGTATCSSVVDTFCEEGLGLLDPPGKVFGSVVLLLYYIVQLIRLYLFRSARTSCTTFGWFVRPVRPSRAKNLDHYIYRHICLMNHEKTHQTNPMAPWDPLDALLTMIIQRIRPLANNHPEDPASCK